MMAAVHAPFFPSPLGGEGAERRAFRQANKVPVNQGNSPSSDRVGQFIAHTRGQPWASQTAISRSPAKSSHLC